MNKSMKWLMSPWNLLSKDLDHVPHAILIHGPRGTGKLGLARSFAQFLLCEARLPASSCGKCEACRWFSEGNHPDFRLVQPEALAIDEPGEGEAAEPPEKEPTGRKAKPSHEIKVEQVRALGSFLYVGSHRGARRVALIQPAETMNVNAANALLKALEEPPPGALFLLVSHEPARLPPTVRSRCVRIAVPVPKRDEALAWLTAAGVSRSERWLDYAGGAPLLALEYATGEQAGARAALMEALAAGTLSSLGATDRESLEMLAEGLQKRALDMAFASLAGGSRYSAGLRAAPTAGPAWLAFAREMGRNRALARRPVNQRLFSAELLGRYASLGGIREKS